MMLHVSQSVFRSAFNTIVARNGFNLSDFWQTVYNEPLTLGSKQMQWISKKVSESGDPDTPVNVIMYFDQEDTFVMTEDNFDVKQNVRFVVSDQDGALYTDFTLKNVDFDNSITSDARQCIYSNHVNNFKFDDVVINEQGSMYFDKR